MELKYHSASMCINKTRTWRQNSRPSAATTSRRQVGIQMLLLLLCTRRDARRGVPATSVSAATAADAGLRRSATSPYRRLLLLLRWSSAAAGAFFINGLMRVVCRRIDAVFAQQFSGRRTMRGCDRAGIAAATAADRHTDGRTTGRSKPAIRFRRRRSSLVPRAACSFDWLCPLPRLCPWPFELHDMGKETIGCRAHGWGSVGRHLRCQRAVGRRCTAHACRRWLDRWTDVRMDGLKDGGRKGKERSRCRRVVLPSNDTHLIRVHTVAMLSPVSSDGSPQASIPVYLFIYIQATAHVYVHLFKQLTNLSYANRFFFHQALCA